MNEQVIEVKQLEKSFSDTRVLKNLNLSISTGQVYGLIGKNAAGKTTLLRIIMGLLHQDQGEATILGKSQWQAPLEHRARISYVSQSQQLHTWMTTNELGKFVSHFYPNWDNNTFQELATQWEIPLDKTIAYLSGGQQRRVAILIAFSSKSEVIILDEPAAGLDPIARRELIDAIVDIVSENSKTTILFSTHIISDLERVATHVGILHNGTMVADSSLDDLKTSSKRLQVIFDDNVSSENFKIPGAIKVVQDGQVINAIARMNDSQLEDFMKTPGVRINTFPLSLEEFFIETIGSDAKAMSQEATL